MLFIRRFEEQLLEEFKSGRLRGTTHTSLGQEAISVACMAHIHAEDTVFGSHRAHGHFLAYGGDPVGLLLEIRGHAAGVCRGIGGSQHLQYRNFFTNGVLGGIAPVSAGMGLAHKVARGGGVAVCFLGDGALGEGVVYEAFNIASLWRLPVLFVIENNGIAQTTPVGLAVAGSMAARPRAFGISTEEIHTSDVLELEAFFGRAFHHVRGTETPFCAVVRTERLGPHSKGDDLRPPEELALARATDPLAVSLASLDADLRERLEDEADARLRQVLDRADGAELRPPEVMQPARARSTANAVASGGLVSRSDVLGVEALRGALFEAMERDARIHLLGEDLLDPYGGAFKVTRGLPTAFPQRVHTTPISEAAIVGVAAGMALCGLRPVVELMFGDFVTLAMDQIVNHVAKFGRMYAGQVRCPVIVRLPMGGYRGYGPTHSQSLEKLLLGVPGLNVLALSPLHDPAWLLQAALSLDEPVILVENKSLYGRRMLGVSDGRVNGFHVLSNATMFPIVRASLDPGARAETAIVVYGGLTETALAAARRYFDETETLVDVIVVSQLSPLQGDDLVQMLGATRRVVTLEEGTLMAGWGAEVLGSLVERCGPLRARRCAAADDIIPSSSAGERAVLPDVDDVIAALRGIDMTL